MTYTANVRKRFALPGNWARGLGDELAAEIMAAVPACHAAYDPAHHALVLEYDRARCGIAEVEPLFEQYGLWPPTGWWQRLRRAWMLYTEQTLRENLRAAPAPCCNRPPHHTARSI